MPTSRPPGYLLELEPERLDLGRFLRLLEEARREPGRAAEKLEEALALWRGPALAEFASEPFARVERLRLEELRLEAFEERIEAELALGRHVALVSELEALVAAEPLRERPRGQLMLALYRCGRQAEALGAYREGRRALVAELGLEPGRQLQELEQAILRQDPELELAKPSTSPPEPVTPPAPAEGAPRRAAPAEERRVVSVLFVDLVGFTARSELADPEDVRAALRPFHAAAKREIERHGGTVEKFIGDAVMGLFGAALVSEVLALRDSLVGGLLTNSPAATPSSPGSFVTWAVRQNFSLPWSSLLRRRWVEAARSIAQGDVTHAVELVEHIGAPSVKAYTRLPAAEEPARAGRQQEAEECLAPALVFFKKVGATRYLAQAEELLGASA